MAVAIDNAESSRKTAIEFVCARHSACLSFATFGFSGDGVLPS